MGEWTWRGFKVVQSIVEHLPRSWAYALAVLASRLSWRFSPLAALVPVLAARATASRVQPEDRVPRARGRSEGPAQDLPPQLPQPRQGLRRPDAASAFARRGDAVAAQG